VKENDEVKDGDTLIAEESLIDSTITPVTTPVDGKIIFLKGTEDNPRKSTIIVNPSISNYEVELYISPKGIGKIKPMQKVLIKLDAFPEDDFGMLEGKINSILPVSIDGKYRAKVDLLNDLKTTENKVIPPQHFIEGRAEILLEDRNLFHRIFGSLLF
jgi:multidrug efflux pump subunit AcrA (membrane-fusion protein)